MADAIETKSVTSSENGSKKMKCEMGEGGRIRGTVVLKKKKTTDFTSFASTVREVGRGLVDRLTGHDLAGKDVSLQFISAVNADPGNELRGKLGKPVHLEDPVNASTCLTSGELAFSLTHHLDQEMGVPGALLIRSNHHSEFFLKTVTLEDVPGHGQIHFVCNSWVYPAQYYTNDRIFFANKTYLPSETPAPLSKYREEELENLRGDGTGERKEWERVYDYACYNDLSEPKKGSKYVRPILGGSSDYPYPRRGRTGRPPTKEDPNVESRLPILQSLSIYVPRDERFSHIKFSDLLAFAVKSVAHFLLPAAEGQFDSTPGEFDNFQEILKIYEGGIKLQKNQFFESIMEEIPSEMLRELLRTDSDGFLKFPTPQVIKEDKSAWRTDEEFAREMLAGVDPIVICCLQEFPRESKLNPENNPEMRVYIEKNLGGLTPDEAIEEKKLFILDHYDILMPFLRGINATSTKTYATRTLLCLKEDGTLKPLAIELILPHPDGDEFGEISKVHMPAKDGIEGSLWDLAKAYVSVNDSGYHQLISHWLRTHAVIEPVVIATNRQLSVLHPIHKLLHPHFRDTMSINGFARQILINAGGALEMTVFPAKFSLEMSSAAYKNWVFPEQALPADLIKRGMAVEDANSRHGLRLVIEDYPFAVDGLEIWFAIETWVRDYCGFYYKNDEMVQEDTELQSWWKELREEGHGDLKDRPWWPKMQSLDELIQTCTIIIWVASALHAAINFGQYPYGGYLPNRPAMSRRFLPKEGTPEYEELETNREKAFLKTVTPQLQTLLGISLVEILSKHSPDEVYLGQRDTPEWTSDKAPLLAFERFGKRLEEIEQRIVDMNNDEKWRNRVGPVRLPYTLLYPSSEVGLTGKGIPNSISI
ncbi:probable linoleate 9S-lipoxygenase 5 [Rhodamnia argentea]|uniref:Lipoxygenase n=1 Tax=Rhodamnia argentea TaxID=178133 RepID=A0ABM3HEI9_9MYRT|nr:probable linoleate 9S-lipoxygenase 5 [Rhodamnia argentea]